MTKTLIAIASIGILTASSAAIAAVGDFKSIDANSDGFLTLEEVQAVHGDWTEANFLESDVDQNGALTEEEYDAAMLKLGN